jgi:hypothetical protein
MREEISLAKDNEKKIQGELDGQKRTFETKQREYEQQNERSEKELARRQEELAMVKENLEKTRAGRSTAEDTAHSVSEEVTKFYCREECHGGYKSFGEESNAKFEIVSKMKTKIASTR